MEITISRGCWQNKTKFVFSINYSTFPCCTITTTLFILWSYARLYTFSIYLILCYVALSLIMRFLCLSLYEHCTSTQMSDSIRELYTHKHKQQETKKFNTHKTSSENVFTVNVEICRNCFFVAFYYFPLSLSLSLCFSVFS